MMGAFVALPLVDFELKLRIRFVLTEAEFARGRQLQGGSMWHRRSIADSVAGEQSAKELAMMQDKHLRNPKCI
jgi:hypothetical protein